MTKIRKGEEKEDSSETEMSRFGDVSGGLPRSVNVWDTINICTTKD
jgi:hypothetical protein